MGASEFDPWKGDNSGGMEEFDGTVKSGVFELNNQFTNDDGTPKASWHVEFLLDNGASWNVNYSIGKGWTVSDDGMSVARTDGEQKNFHKKTLWWQFVEHAIKAGAEDALRKSGKTPLNADLFDGMRFHFENTTFAGGKDFDDYDKIMPTAYLGEGSETNGTAPAGSNAAPKGELSHVVRTQLEELAASIKADGGTHDTFVERAFGIPNVDGNEVAEAAVLDQGAIWDSVTVSA